MTGNTHKAQSAMEYLMTYGWAILIIAVVLGALFVLGVFNGSNLTTSACSGNPGYLCSNPIYRYSTGNILATVGQESGTNWISANFVFVGSGVQYVNGVPNVSFSSSPANTMYATQELVSGEPIAISLPATGPQPIGTTISGDIWVQYSYTTSEAGVPQTVGPYYAEVASLNLKAS